MGSPHWNGFFPLAIAITGVGIVGQVAVTVGKMKSLDFIFEKTVMEAYYV
jgi:hypothetical protein